MELQVKVTDSTGAYTLHSLGGHIAFVTVNTTGTITSYRISGDTTNTNPPAGGRVQVGLLTDSGSFVNYLSS